MSETTNPIPARLKNIADGGHVAGTSDIFDDIMGKTQETINAEIEDKLANMSKAGFGYGVCSTTGSTAAKAVAVRDFSLVNMGIVSVLFTDGFTAASPTLNVNGTGAKPIYYHGVPVSPSMIRSYRNVVMQYYDGKWNVIMVENRPMPEECYDWVDLGLPSGTLWAKRNIGAENPEDVGKYFSWGNVEGHVFGDGYEFKDGDYELTLGSTLTTSITPGGSYDAASVILNGMYKMPSVSDFVEMASYCTVDDSADGKSQILTSTINGKSIVIPYAGYILRNVQTWIGMRGFYWTVDISTGSNANDFHFRPDTAPYQESNLRRFGMPIRPIL